MLRWERDLLYLDRYHRLETQVCDDLVARAAAAAARGRRGAARGRAGGGARRARQRRAGGGGRDRRPPAGRRSSPAAPAPARPPRSPGCSRCSPTRPPRRGERISVALTAPTGKAASRLQEAVTAELAGLAGVPEAVALLGHPQGVTLHRLLGWRPDNATRFRHDRSNRLKHDVVVVDESSMVELTMMARLLEALRPDSRLILVGDPRAADVGRAPARCSATWSRGYEATGRLAGRRADPRTSAPSTRSRRWPPRSSAEDADERARRAAHARASRCRSSRPRPRTTWWPRCGPTLAAAARASASAPRPRTPRGALDALDRHRLLCAHREGPYGVRRWNALVERWLAEESVGDLGGPRRLVRRPAAARDHQRLRPRRLQRRDRVSSYARACAAGSFVAGSGAAARLRPRPSRRRRDHARDDDPQGPGQPGRPGHRAAARRRVRGCSPASSSTPPSPAPRTTSAWSAPRPPSAPPSPRTPSAPPASPPASLASLVEEGVLTPVTKPRVVVRWPERSLGLVTVASATSSTNVMARSLRKAC